MPLGPMDDDEDESILPTASVDQRIGASLFITKINKVDIRGEFFHDGADLAAQPIRCSGKSRSTATTENSSVDPEKVIFRHIEVEHWRLASLAG